MKWIAFALMFTYMSFLVHAEEIHVSDRPLTSVSFSPDNAFLAVGGADGKLRVGPVKTWGRDSRTLRRETQKPDEPEYHRITDVCFSSSTGTPVLAVAAVFITHSGNTLLDRWHTIDLWDVKAEKIIWSSARGALGGPANELRFSSEGKHLISADSAGVVAVFDLQNPHPVFQMKFANPATAIGFHESTAGPTLLVGTADRSQSCQTVMLYHRSLDGREVETPFEQRCPVLSIAIDRRMFESFAIGSSVDPYLQWYDTRNGCQILTLHRRPVVGVEIIKASQTLLSVDESGVVGIWDLAGLIPKLVKSLVVGIEDEDVGVGVNRIAVSRTDFAAVDFSGNLTIIPLSQLTEKPSR